MLASIQLQVQPLEDGTCTVFIGKVQVAEGELAAECRGRSRIRAVGDVGRFLQDVGDAFGRGQGLGEASGVLGVFAHRAHGVLQVRDEDEQIASRERAGDHLQRTLPQHQGRGAGHQQVDGALQTGREPLGVHVGVGGLAVIAAEHAREAFFQRQRLHGADGRHRFGCRGGQRSFTGTLTTAGLVDEPAAALGRQPHHRQRDERDQRQLPVQHEHHPEHAHQDEDVGHHRQQGRDRHFAKLTHVVDQAQRQVAAALALMEGQRQAQQPVVEHVADLAEHFVADARKAHGGQEAGQCPQGGKGHHRHGREPDDFHRLQAAQPLAQRLVAVLRVAQHVVHHEGQRPGFGQPHQGAEQQCRQRAGQQWPLSLHEGTEAFQDAADGAAGGACVFLGHGKKGSSCDGLERGQSGGGRSDHGAVRHGGIGHGQNVRDDGIPAVFGHDALTATAPHGQA